MGSRRRCRQRRGRRSGLGRRVPRRVGKGMLDAGELFVSHTGGQIKPGDLGAQYRRYRFDGQAGRGLIQRGPSLGSWRHNVEVGVVLFQIVEQLPGNIGVVDVDQLGVRRLAKRLGHDDEVNQGRLRQPHGGINRPG